MTEWDGSFEVKGLNGKSHIVDIQDIQSIYKDDDVIYFDGFPYRLSTLKPCFFQYISDGAKLICIERDRQVNEEGYTNSHDDRNSHYELSNAAICYLNPTNSNFVDDNWPTQWSREYFNPSPAGEHIRNFVKAGALIAAEIDRLLRKGEK
jgi:hypothetical protein